MKENCTECHQIPDSAEPPVYVVIASHARPDLAVRTIRSLLESVLPEAYQGAVVIENGSQSSELQSYIAGVDSRFNMSYRHIPEPNKSKALNAAVRDLPEDCLVVFFDDDVSVHPYTLGAYALAASRHPDCAFFGGPVLPDYESEPPLWLLPYLTGSARGRSWGSEEKKLDPEKPIDDSECFIGLNWAVRCSALAEVGGFDPALGPGTASNVGEETQLQFRLLKHGLGGRYLPDAVVWHHVPEERCSPEWALEKAFTSQKSGSYLLKSKSCCFFWLILLKNIVCFPCLLVLVLCASPLLSLKRRFRLRYVYNICRGYLAGLFGLPLSNRTAACGSEKCPKMKKR